MLKKFVACLLGEPNYERCPKMRILERQFPPKMANFGDGIDCVDGRKVVVMQNAIMNTCLPENEDQKLWWKASDRGKNRALVFDELAKGISLVFTSAEEFSETQDILVIIVQLFLRVLKVRGVYNTAW